MRKITKGKNKGRYVDEKGNLYELSKGNKKHRVLVGHLKSK